MESVIALIRSFTSSVSSLLIRTPVSHTHCSACRLPLFCAYVRSRPHTFASALGTSLRMCERAYFASDGESQVVMCVHVYRWFHLTRIWTQHTKKHLLCRPLAPRHEVVLHKKAGSEYCCVSAKLDWVILSGSCGNGFVCRVSRVLVYGVTDKEHGDFTQFSLGKSSKVTVKAPAPLLFVKWMFYKAEIILRSNTGKHVCTFIMAQTLSM